MRRLVGKACLLVSTHPGCSYTGIASTATVDTTVRLKGSWSLLPLAGLAASTGTDDGGRPLIPPVGSSAAGGLLFLGGVLADGVEALAVSHKPFTAIVTEFSSPIDCPIGVG